MSFKIDPPRKVSMSELVKQRDHDRGITPMPLDAELLLKRVKQGGFSGEFLADAFLSAYRKSWQFHYALFDLCKLDAEAFRLFHQILHIRHVPGWNDDQLHLIEKHIMSTLVDGGIDP